MSKTPSLGSFVTLFCVKSSCYLLLWRTIVQRVFSHNSRQRQVVIEHLQNGKSDLLSSIFHMLSFILTWLLQKQLLVLLNNDLQHKEVAFKTLLIPPRNLRKNIYHITKEILSKCPAALEKRVFCF